MKQTTFTFLFICMCFTAKAQQCLSYAYDAAGNRIGRSIVLQAQASKTLRKTTDSTFVYEMLAEKQLKIYPNPVKSMLTISIAGYDTSMQGDFSLFNYSGAMALKGKIEEEITQLDMGFLPQGTYILKINLKGQPTSWKIIKQ